MRTVEVSDIEATSEKIYKNAISNAGIKLKSVFKTIVEGLEKVTDGIEKFSKERFDIDLRKMAGRVNDSKLVKMGKGIGRAIFTKQSNSLPSGMDMTTDLISARLMDNYKIYNTSGVEPPSSTRKGLFSRLRDGLGNVRDDINSKSDKRTLLGKLVGGISSRGKSATDALLGRRDYFTGYGDMELMQRGFRTHTSNMSNKNTFVLPGSRSLDATYVADVESDKAKGLIQEVEVLEEQIDKQEITEHEAKAAMYRLASKAELTILDSQMAKEYYTKMADMATSTSSLGVTEEETVRPDKDDKNIKKAKRGFFGRMLDGAKNIMSDSHAKGKAKGLSMVSSATEWVNSRKENVAQTKADVLARMDKKNNGKGLNVLDLLKKIGSGIFSLPGLLAGLFLAPKGPLLSGLWWMTKKLGGVILDGVIGSVKWLGKHAGKWMKNAFLSVGGKIKDWVVSGMTRAGTAIANSVSSAVRAVMQKPLELLSSFGEKIASFGKSVVAGAKGLFTKTGNAIANSGVGKAAKSAWGWGKNLLGKAKSFVGNSMVGKAFSKAGKFVAKHGVKVIAKQALKKLATAAAFVFSGPVGWAVGIGFLLWDVYDAYKFIAGDGEIPTTDVGDIIRLRLLSYGLNDNNKSNYKKLFELEEVTGPLFKYESNTKDVVMVEPEDQVADRITNVLGTMDDGVTVEEYKLTWYTDRFLPAYRSFLRALWSVNDTIKPGDISKLNEAELAKLVHSYDVDDPIFDVKGLPYPETLITTVNKSDFEELHIFLKNRLKGKLPKPGETDEDRTNRVTKANIDENQRQEASGKAAAVVSSTSVSSTNARNNVVKDATKEVATTRTRNFQDYFKDPSQTGDIGSFSGFEGVSNNERAIGEGNPEFEGDIGGMVSLPEAFRKAAEMTGIPEDILWTMAKIESGLNITAKNPQSSASGLFQFINGTWKEMINKHGKKYGLDMNNANRFNPLHSAIMAGEYIRSNLPYIKDYKEIGIDLGTAAYLAHFSGPGGARSLFSAFKSNPNRSMASWASPSVYRANRSLMANKSIAQFIQHFVTKYKKKEAIDPRTMAGFKAHMNKYGKLYKPEDNNIKYMNDGVNSIGEGIPAMVKGSSADNVQSVGNGSYNPGSVNNYSEGNASMPSFSGSGANGMKMSSYLNLMTGGVMEASRSHGGGGGNTFSGDGGGMSSNSGASNYTGSFGGGEGNEHYGNSGGDQTAFNNYNNRGRLIKFNSADGPVKVHPIKDGSPYTVSSLFGPRKPGVAGASDYHQGLDFAVVIGTPIVATADGKVIRVNPNGTGYGKVIYIQHAGGWETRYAHLSHFGCSVGQTVKAGGVIALSGNTGISGGPHLHYETRLNDIPVDPMHFDVIRKGVGGTDPLKPGDGVRKPPGKEAQLKAHEKQLKDSGFEDNGGDTTGEAVADSLGGDSGVGSGSASPTNDQGLTAAQLDASVPKFENTDTYKKEVVDDGRGMTQQQLDASVPSLPETPKVEVDIKTESMEKALKENTLVMNRMANILELMSTNLAGDIASGIGGVLPKKQAPPIGFDRPGKLDVSLSN